MRLKIGVCANTFGAAKKAFGTSAKVERFWKSIAQEHGRLDNQVSAYLKMTVVLFSLTLFSHVHGETIYVSQDGGEDYDNISMAVYNAKDGDEIVVADGVYEENIASLNKKIIIRSKNGASGCVIKGYFRGAYENTYYQAKSVYDCTNTVLKGLTFTGNNSTPVIGGQCFDCMVLNNAVFVNVSGADFVGGVLYSHCTKCLIANNTIRQDTGYSYCLTASAAAYSSLNGCVVTKNSCKGSIENPILRGCDVISSTVLENTPSAYACSGTFVNSIVLHNIDYEYRLNPHGSEGVYMLCAATNCCALKFNCKSVNCITDIPIFLEPSVAYSYVLDPDSTCVDAADAKYACGLVDFLGNDRVFGRGMDIGAFETQQYRVRMPIVLPESEMYSEAFKVVSLSCDTEGALIYYTVDGSEPSVANGRIYKEPFNIYLTTTVKAIAVKDDWIDSKVATATFTKENALGPAINLLEVLPDNDKTYPWTVVSNITHDGISAAKSGDISDNESTTMKVVLYGAGELSFWWRTSCEPMVGGDWYDYATFYDGTTVVTNLAGVTDWQRVVWNVDGAGKHTFKWTYQKDDSGSASPDGVWVDQVQWLPKTDEWYSDHTLTTVAPVKYSWLRQYGLAITNDFEAATCAATGKRDGAGRSLTVEDDFIAGTDPTNGVSVFAVSIALTNGVPYVQWSPDLNEAGVKSLRDYKIWGKAALDGGSSWEYPTNATHRFFRVTVEMP